MTIEYKNFNSNDILKYLPHREPFLFIDQIQKITHPDISSDPSSTSKLVGGEVFARYKVKENMDVFRGHFPGNPVFPGVLQVEMIGQAACLLIFVALESYNMKSQRVALLSVEKAKFRKPLLPGMVADIHAKLVKSRGNMLSYEGAVYVDEQKYSEATILATIDLNAQK